MCFPAVFLVDGQQSTIVAVVFEGFGTDQLLLLHSWRWRRWLWARHDEAMGVGC
jgi:hypothetical protein